MAAAARGLPPPNPPSGGLPRAPPSAIDLPQATSICGNCARTLPISSFVKTTRKKTIMLKTCAICRGSSNKFYAKRKGDVLSPPKGPDSLKRVSASPIPSLNRSSPANQPSTIPRLLPRENHPGITLKSPITSSESQGQQVGVPARRGRPRQRGGAPETRSRIPQPTWRPRGQFSQDAPATAAARRERVGIQRRHRAEARAGQEPSSTPSLSAIAARNRAAHILPVPPTSSPLSSALSSSQLPLPSSSSRQRFGPGASSSSSFRIPTATATNHPSSSPFSFPYFTCDICDIIRANVRKVRQDPDVCFYCVNGYTHGEPEMQMKWCLRGGHERIRTWFFDDDDAGWGTTQRQSTRGLVDVALPSRSLRAVDVD